MKLKSLATFQTNTYLVRDALCDHNLFAKSAQKIRLEKTNACTHTNILGWREMFKSGAKYEDNKERKM